MSLTRVDYVPFRGSRTSSDSSSFIALNPHKTPGSLVLGCSTAVRQGIGSQVACKIALEHFIEGVLSFYDRLNSAFLQRRADTEMSVQVLETAFREANNSVYSFGHQLKAGGRLSASLLGVVIEERMVSAGRVGGGSVYLYRGGEVLPFFEESEDGAGENLVGSQSAIAVQLASIEMEPNDTVIVFSRKLDKQEEERLNEVIEDIEPTEGFACEYLCRKIFGSPDELAFASVARIGPETIYLKQAV